MLAAPGFYPTPHSKALFIENFHANNFVAGGLRGIYNLNGDAHFRLEGYAFLPFHEIYRDEDYKPIRGEDFVKNVYFQGMAALVYQTGLGPASITLNYYDKSSTRWYLMFNFGYILFNRKGF